MKLTKYWKCIALIFAVTYSCTVTAITREEEEGLKECRKPKFRDFTPAPVSEVPPESELAFHVSRGADPHSITAEAKAVKMAVTVQDKTTFLLAKAKLPASLREGFARIHVTAKAEDGDCLGQDGWLLKIKAEETPTVRTVENK